MSKSRYIKQTPAGSQVEEVKPRAQLPWRETKRNVKRVSLALHLPNPTSGTGNWHFCHTGSHTLRTSGCDWDQYYCFLWVVEGGNKTQVAE